MKTDFLLKLLCFWVIITFFSCKKSNNNSEAKGKLLTERIQYDVLIKTPDTELDWWVQNIEGSKRQSVVNKFIELAYSGKYKIYDYFNTPITSEELKKNLNYEEKLTLQRNVSPYELYDTVIKHELDIKKITKLRFLEEWYLNEKNLSFEKKVVGIMPMREYFKDSVMYYSPLFWLYFDPSYPEKLK